MQRDSCWGLQESFLSPAGTKLNDTRLTDVTVIFWLRVKPKSNTISSVIHHIKKSSQYNSNNISQCYSGPNHSILFCCLFQNFKDLTLNGGSDKTPLMFPAVNWKWTFHDQETTGRVSLAVLQCYPHRATINSGQNTTINDPKALESEQKTVSER